MTRNRAFQAENMVPTVTIHLRYGGLVRVGARFWGRAVSLVTLIFYFARCPTIWSPTIH